MTKLEEKKVWTGPKNTANDWPLTKIIPSLEGVILCLTVHWSSYFP